ncbi:MAG: hypothetical protein M1831_002690 [Alyxoria varia]|nr:MAG: hypothetical protein M1831_002690 [Alyxoria varia]
MGSSSSKAARTATGAASRKYPSRSPADAATRTGGGLKGENEPSPSQRPQQKQQEKLQASQEKNQDIDLDARDPHLAESLRRIGPVQPNPTFSPSSTSYAPKPQASSSSASPTPSQAPSPANNAALATLAARERIQAVYEEEKADIGRSGFQGKSLLDISTIRRILVLRDEQGMQLEEIERTLGLKNGLVKSFGGIGTVEAA